jgi:hypothetical protein
MDEERQAAPPLIEPVPVSDTFATGMAWKEEHERGFVRLTFYADRASAFDNAMRPITPERIVVARIVIPTDTYRRIVAVAIEAECDRRLPGEPAHMH